MNVRHGFNLAKDSLAHWIARRLPGRVRMYACINVCAKASTTVYKDRTPDQISILDVIGMS